LPSALSTVPSVKTNRSKPVSTVWLPDGPSTTTWLPEKLIVAAVSAKPNVIVSVPASPSNHRVPAGAA
jgi:hypothetical protein